MKIAVVEDDPFFLDNLEFFLDENHIEFSAFDDASRFLEADIGNYDAIILDIMMISPPTVCLEQFETGEWLYNKVRSQCAKIPIIVMTAKAKHELQIDFTDCNTFYIPKPLLETDVDIIVNILNSYK